MHTFLLSSRLGRWLAVAVLALLAAPGARAQLSGAKAIPGDYATVAAAITALNAQGVGAGGVTFNIAAGYTETFASATAGAITATGTAANPIVFQKAGTGARPVITAGVGTAALDAIISLAGSDYVTFDGLELTESTANTTTATQMEFGFVLFRPSPTDGCQFNSIRNCVVTLNKANTATFGIYGAASTAALATSVAATSPSGANSNNKVDGNVITNSATGMYFTASTATTVANYDVSNEIGVISPNSVYNFGTTATGWGIGGNYQSAFKVVNNVVNNTLNYVGGSTTPVAASTVTSTLRGIYGNTCPSASIDITGNAVTLASGATTSLMTGIDNGIGSTPASNTVNITGNSVTLTYATATSAAITGITNSGGATTVNITGNTVQNSTAAAATTATFIGITSSAGAAINLNNNTVSNNVVAGTGTMTLISSSLVSATSPVSISNNTLTGNGKTPTGTTASTTLLCLTLGSATTTITGNTITNNTIVTAGTSTTAGTLTGINSTASSTTSEILSNNVVTGLSISGTSTATTHTVRGILTAANGSGDVQTLTQNTIGGLAIASGSGTVVGISVPTGGGTGSSIARNKIYDLSATGAAASVTGLLISAGGTYAVANNLIGDLRTPAATGLLAIAGLNVSGSTAVNAYYNTLYLNATSTGATFGTSGIYLNSTSATLDARNNVVVNKSAAAGTGGYTAALRRVSGTTGTAPANLASTTNNNLYYAGTPAAANLIYVEGTTTATNAQQTLAAYKVLVAPRESNSVTEDAPFLSTTGSAATFLHINPAVATQVEGGGIPIASIANDFDGDARNATSPDLGADEGTFLANDQIAPTIAYTVLSNTSSTSSRTLTATITDASGVATGTGAPRIYYRSGTSGAFFSAVATSVSGSSYTFTINYANIGGTPAPGTTIQYYVAAQDASPNGNAGTNPTGGAGTNPPGSTAPATFNSYQILATLSGTYYVTATVGSSPNPAKEFATLTAAAAAYNSNGLSGAVTFVLLDAAYGAGETFPIQLLNNLDASATNTLTIKPNTGLSTTLTGSNATAILQLTGSDYVTLDGSNGGTLSATDPRPSRNWTITNTNTGTTSNVVVLTVFTAGTDNATNNTFKNLVVTGSGAAATQTGIIMLSTTAATAANSNNKVLNNAVSGSVYGIYTSGASATLKNSGTVISQNDMTGTGTGAIGRFGITAYFEDGIQLTQNTVDGISFAGTGDVWGISAGFNGLNSTTFTGNEVTNASISRNYVGVVKQTNTYSAVGIGLAAATSGTSVISNNMVTGVSSNGTSGDFGAGILIGGGAGSTTRILYNSVSMTGTQTGGNYPSFALAIGGSTPTVEIRNNALLNTQSTGNNSVALGLAYSSTTGAYVGLTSDHNDFFVGPGSTYAVGQTGSLGTSGTLRPTLAALNTETGQDNPATSKNADPQFVSATNLHSTSPQLNAAAVPVSGITVDFDGETRDASTPDIGADEFTPPACPAVTGLTFASITTTSASLSFTPPTGGAGATSYTVTYTPAGGTATTVAPNPTGSPVVLSGLTANTVYTVTVVTNCTSATSPSTTGTFRTACVPPTYAALPASEGFESTWLSRCDTREVPSATWLNTPTTGNNSWRRDDDGTAANWTSPTSGSFTPAGSQGSAHAARFHSYYTATGVVGTLDFYVDLSAAGTKRLTFDYVNPSTDGSKLEVLLSTDGGATFGTTPLLSVATSASFSARTVDLTAASATSVIRFRATGDFGTYDLGLDNVLVRLLPNVDLAATGLAAPTATQGCYSSAETVTVTVSNPGAQAIDFSVNPATVTATVTTPNGPQILTGTVSTGTLAVGATRTVTLTPTLDMTAVGTYTFALVATATGDGNTANDALTPAPTRTVVAPVAGTLAPAGSTVCVSGTASLSLTGAANGSIQYQSSSDNVTFADIAGATSATYITPVLTNTTYFRAQVRCGTAVATSNVSTITVNNPLVAGTNTPVAICAGSTATLTATASTGSSIRFFDVATGGTALATATAGSYTTAALTASATYYAEAFTGGIAVAGLTDNSAANGTFSQSSSTDYPLGFAVTQAGVLASVDVYPTTAGTLTIRLYRVAGTQPGGTATAVAGSDVTSTITAAQVGTRVTIPLNYTLAAGDYKLSNFAGGLGRFSTYTGTYPLASANGALTVKGSYTFASSTSYSNATYNSFFNLTFNSECVGATRTAIQVNVTQPATASFATATGSSCGTSAYPLAGTVGGSATGGTYTSSGTGTFSPNASSLTATYTPSAADVAAGAVTITLTSGGSTPCPAATATFALSISPAPVATFSYPAATTYCAGSASTVSPTLGSSATAGTFSSTAGLTLDPATGAITLGSSTAGTYTVTNTVAASGACAATSATAQVTITPATTATFSYGSSTFCVSGTNPVATVTGTSGGTFGSTAGLTLDASTGAITLSSSTPGTYAVTYTVAGPCGSSSIQSVTITTAPVAAFSYGTTSTYCASGTTNPTVVLGTGATAGTFSSTAGLTLNATTGAITLSSSTPGTYTVTNTVAASGGCAATAATAQVTITAAPTATFSYPVTIYCAGGNTTTPTPVLAAGATAGTFTSTTGLVIDATTGVVNTSTSTAGIYTVTNTVAAAGGCVAATATATITISPRPTTPTLTATYNGATTTLTSSPVAGTTPGTYQFYFNGTLIPGATSQTYVVNGTPTQLGSYTVTTTNANGCTSLPSAPLVVTDAKTGLAGASLKLYPNPTPSGQVTLELTGYRSATQLTVLDALGRVVTQQLLPANAGTATHNLDLTGAATGVYLLRLSNADGVETRRLVRE